MTAGRYHTPIAFQRQGDTRDAAGQPSQTYTTFHSDAGAISPITGREAIDAGLETAESGLRVTVRYGPTAATVTANDRMVIRGTDYNIIYAEPNFDRSAILFIGRAVR